MITDEKNRIAYLVSPAYTAACNLLPMHQNREHMTECLLDQLLLERKDADHNSIDRVAPALATFKDLAKYHAVDYLNILRKSMDDISAEECDEYQLVDDCYLFPDLFHYCRSVVGSSITGARVLCSDSSAYSCAVNFGGGRHHAKKDHASGFCYINDVVLAAMEFQKHGLQKVLIIDLDVHHGDGQEQSFYFSSNVFTVSFHKCAAGYFPGTGQSKYVGQGSGRYTNLNVPLLDGIEDEQYVHVVKTIVAQILLVFQAQAIIVVCGVDTLGTDPLGTFNLSSRGIATCVSWIARQPQPVLILGGGGYCLSDAARCYATILMALTLDRQSMGRDIFPDETTHLDLQLQRLMEMAIPEHEYFPCYGPDFRMNVKRVIHRKNMNSNDSLRETIERALRHLVKYVNHHHVEP